MKLLLWSSRFPDGSGHEGSFSCLWLGQRHSGESSLSSGVYGLHLLCGDRHLWALDQFQQLHGCGRESKTCESQICQLSFYCILEMKCIRIKFKMHESFPSALGSIYLIFSTECLLVYEVNLQLCQEPDLSGHFQLHCALSLSLLHPSLWRQAAPQVSIRLSV